MGLQETVVSAWYMACSVCGEWSKYCLTPEEALSEVRKADWISKSYYKNLLACEDWYCFKCLPKATEVRDTLPAAEEVESPKEGC